MVTVGISPLIEIPQNKGSEETAADEDIVFRNDAPLEELGHDPDGLALGEDCRG